MSEIFKNKGIIKAVKKDKKGFQLDDGKWYTGFKELSVSKGQAVQFDYTINGDFRNIHNGSLSVDPTNVTQDYPQANPTSTIDKDRLIVRQSCLKAAVEFGAVADIDVLLGLAEKMENWVFR